jgi:DNA-3-methyladenine glycosylase II
MRKAVEHLRAGDARMAELIARVGPCRIRYSPPDYETVARSIVSQQLSGKAAATIYRRLEDAAGPSGVTPAAVLSFAPEQMRSFGLSAAKCRYLRSLAEKTLDGTVDFRRLPRMSDGEVVAHLTAIQGVGVWTAHMFLIFALRRKDVLPVGDVGIRNAIRTLYRLKKAPAAAEMERIARPWRPYASVACWYLWRSLEFGAEL